MEVASAAVALGEAAAISNNNNMETPQKDSSELMRESTVVSEDMFLRKEASPSSHQNKASTMTASNNHCAVVSDHASSPPTPPSIPSAVCQICGQGDSPCKRLCFFLPNAFTNQSTILHVFCGKTAAILPNINRPELEILTKSGIKNKLGTSPQVMVAMQRSRSAVVDNGERQQVYYLITEVQEHLQHVNYQHYLEQQQHSMALSSPIVAYIASKNTTTTTTAPVNDPTVIATTTASDQTKTTTAETKYEYTNPRPPPETMEVYKSVQPPAIPPPRLAPAAAAPPPGPPPCKRLKPTLPTKSPYELLMENLQTKSDAVGGVGYSLVRGVSPGVLQDDYFEEDEEHFDPKLCSAQQVSHVRILIITESRQHYMEHFVQRISSEDDEINNASLVWNAWRTFPSNYKSQKSFFCKFDMLLGFTDAVKDYNAWITVPECKEYKWNKMLAGLAKYWKALLKKSTRDLGIDAEFTMPGVLCLLQDFKEQVEAMSLEFPFAGVGGK